MTDDDGGRSRSWDDPVQPGDPGPVSGDPLLVRPWIAGDGSRETWPAGAARPQQVYRGVAAAGPAVLEQPPPAGPAERARPVTHRYESTFPSRRAMILLGAGLAAVLGLTAAGIAALLPGDGRPPQALPAGNLPPELGLQQPGAPGGTAGPGGGNGPGGPQFPQSQDPRRPSAGASISTSAGAGRSAGAPAPPAAPGNGPGNAVPTPGPTLSDPPKGAVSGVIGTGVNLCLDLDGGTPLDHTLVQVLTCNESTAQVWTLEPDGTLRVVNLCAQVTADKSVEVIGCAGFPATQWRMGPGNTIVNVATNGCLTDPGNGAASGTRVVVAACGGGGNQTWALP